MPPTGSAASALGALGASVLFLLSLVSEPLRPAGAAWQGGSVASAAIGLVLSLVVAWVARREQLSREAFADLAVGFEIGIGGVLWGMEFAAPFGTTTHTPGIPTVAGWLLFFPVLVPLPLRTSVMAAFVVVLMGPVVLVAYLAGGQPPPTASHAIVWFVPVVLAGAASVVTSQVLQHAYASLRDARARDQYVLLERLGAGGMGEVFVARHARLARLAAVKRIRWDALGPSTVSATRDRIRRFEDEAHATARLRSPHTVELYDFGTTEDGDLYYAMELLDGMDLQDAVERFGPMSPARVVHLLLQACDSLAEAHGMGLVHRDIKPANLMVCRKGVQRDVLKVLDFGTVKASRAPFGRTPTQAGVLVGTPAYSAPEAQEGEATASSDLYSLACVGWWLLTGERLFESEDLLSELRHHRVTEVPPLHELAPAEVPPDLEALLRAILAKAQEDRPPDAQAVARQLRALEVAPWTPEQAQAWWDRHGGPSWLDTLGEEHPLNAGDELI